MKQIQLWCDAGFFDGRFIEYLGRNKKEIHYVIKVKMKNMVQMMGLGSIIEWKKIGENLVCRRNTLQGQELEEGGEESLW